MTTPSHFALLPDRGVIAVTGEDARGFLDNLITNDMDLLDRQDAIHAALLTPQGKILFAFFVIRHGDGFLLETLRTSVADLMKRLTLYKLRAKVTLNDLSSSRTIVAAWGAPPADMPLAVAFRDPRHADLGHRMIMAPEMAAKLATDDESQAAYDRHRIALGVPEAGRDYDLADTFPHEANFDRLAGVSFSKGCFVGQEVVARMQHKTVVRKRIVRIQGGSPLSEGAAIKTGDTMIGRVGTASSDSALAMLRLDRAEEIRAKGDCLTADGIPISVDAAVLDAFARAQSPSA